MSKTVKEFMMRDYERWIEGCDNALVVSIRGVPANENNRLRQELARQNIAIHVVRNTLAKKVFAETSLAGLSPLLDGPSAIAYGGETVVDAARELVKWAKEVENLELKGAILDGELFEGPDGVERLSKMPTREEALSQAVTLVLSPGQKLVGQIKGPGSRVVGIIKSIEERLENGEEIAKTG